MYIYMYFSKLHTYNVCMKAFKKTYIHCMYATTGIQNSNIHTMYDVCMFFILLGQRDVGMCMYQHPQIRPDWQSTDGYWTFRPNFICSIEWLTHKKCTMYVCFKKYILKTYIQCMLTVYFRVFSHQNFNVCMLLKILHTHTFWCMYVLYEKCMMPSLDNLYDETIYEFKLFQHTMNSKLQKHNEHWNNE